jgi:hypothetical protein
MFRAMRSTFIVAAAAAALFLFVQTADAARCFFYSQDIGMVCDARAEGDTAEFEQPEVRDDSLLEYTSYAYMEDNINIYPEPSLGVAPLYNVGDGFLYVTIQGQIEANGHTWYVVNPDQYVLADDIRLVDTPEFHGVEVTVQPERPFGWIVQEVRPSNEPDGEPNPDYAKLERFTFFQVFDAVKGEEDWIWYQIGGDRWIRQTQVSLVDVTAPPEDIAAGEFWVEVDLYEQSFAAYEGSRMVYAGLVSSGLNRWPTYEGIYQVFSRHLQTRMSGAEGQVDYYYVEDVPYTMYFDETNEIALHGAYWHDRYGYKHSHGCVNMPPRDAEWIYYWSADAPSDLWVWVHTSDPNDYLDNSA